MIKDRFRSRKSFGARVNLHESIVHYVLWNKKKITLQQAFLWAEVLRVSPSDLEEIIRKEEE